MHQHPRAPPASASPALSEQTNPTRTNNPRDLNALRTNSPLTQGSGSSEDFQPREQQSDPAAQMQRLNQVVQNFFTKSVLIILHSRVDLPPAYAKNSEAKRVNRWFNIELQETEEYREDIRRWKTCDVKDDRPPALSVEVFLTTESLPQGQRLVIVDEDGKRWDVLNALGSSSKRSGKRRENDPAEVLLERWTIDLGDQIEPLPSDMATVLPAVYKQSIVLFRALFARCNWLPAWKLSRRLGKSRSTMAMKIGYRLVSGQSTSSLRRSDNLNLPLTDSTSEVASDYSFGSTPSPAGPFSVRVTYRDNCDFRIDDSEELLSSRFLGTDDDLFRPSMPSEHEKQDRTRVDVGSLPADRRAELYDRPELGHAYGSLSTFHSAGIGTGTSPLSALRSARDYSTPSPPTPEPTRPPLQPQVSTSSSSRNSLRAQAAGRRSSFSVQQPFKQPTLSASPLGMSPLGTSPRITSGHIPTLGSLTEEAAKPAPNAQAVAARKPSSLASDAVASSTSSSPKPAPVTRYSSSFSHRRARLSSGGTTIKSDEDQTGTGRTSTSSSAQPGSGLLAETAGTGNSSESMQDDDESIQDFLKLLDTKKDLLHPEEAAAAASTRRTAAALHKFHRMKDSNAALSDSLSSSLMLHRSSSSSSRQLSSVPPMVAATSTSTSPGKPLSPHTPHTPFAPSRLSAAYSHDDDVQAGIMIEEQPPSPSEATTSDTTQATSSTNVPPMNIPLSPRPFLDNYRRASSAQRQPLSDDAGDIYSMRSASMGAQQRRLSGRPESPMRAVMTQEPDISPTTTEPRPNTAAAALPPEVNLEAESARSSNMALRRLPRGSGREFTPPHGSTSSFGGAGSADKSANDSGSASSSWKGIGRRAGSRPDNTFPMDEDDLPFAMETSHHQSGSGR
jgi:autophagy-related protein 13